MERLAQQLSSTKATERKSALKQVANSITDSDSLKITDGPIRLLALSASAACSDKVPAREGIAAIKRAAKLSKHRKTSFSQLHASIGLLTRLLRESTIASDLEACLADALSVIVSSNTLETALCGAHISDAAAVLSHRLMQQPELQASRLAPPLEPLCSCLRDAGCTPENIQIAANAVDHALHVIHMEDSGKLKEVLSVAESLLLYCGLELLDPSSLCNTVIITSASAWEKLRTLRHLLASTSRAAIQLCGPKIHQESLFKLWRRVYDASRASVSRAVSFFSTDDDMCRARSLLADLYNVMDEHLYASECQDDTESNFQRKRQRLNVPRLHEIGICGSFVESEITCRLLSGAKNSESLVNADTAGHWLQAISKWSEPNIHGIAIMALAASLPSSGDAIPPDGKDTWRRVWAHALSATSTLSSSAYEDACSRLAACLACTASADCAWPGVDAILTVLSKLSRKKGNNDDTIERNDSDKLRAAACAAVLERHGGPGMQRSDWCKLLKAALHSYTDDPIGGQLAAAAAVRREACIGMRAISIVRGHALPICMQQSFSLNEFDRTVASLRRSKCLDQVHRRQLAQSRQYEEYNETFIEANFALEGELIRACSEAPDKECTLHALASIANEIKSINANEIHWKSGSKSNRGQSETNVCKDAACAIASAASLQRLHLKGDTATVACRVISWLVSTTSDLQTWAYECLSKPLLHSLNSCTYLREMYQFEAEKSGEKLVKDDQQRLSKGHGNAEEEFMDIDDLSALAFIERHEEDKRVNANPYSFNNRTRDSLGETFRLSPRNLSERSAALSCIGTLEECLISADEVFQSVGHLGSDSLHMLALGRTVVRSSWFLPQCEKVIETPSAACERLTLIKVLEFAAELDPSESARLLEMLSSQMGGMLSRMSDNESQNDLHHEESEYESENGVLYWSAVEREALCACVSLISHESLPALLDYASLLGHCEKSLSLPGRQSRIAAAWALACTMAQADGAQHSELYPRIVQNVSSDNVGPGMEARFASFTFAAMASAHAEPMAVGQMLKEAGDSLNPGSANRAAFARLCIERLAAFFHYGSFCNSSHASVQYIEAVSSQVAFAAGDEVSELGFVPWDLLEAHIHADELALSSRIRKPHGQTNARACARVLLAEGAIPEQLNDIQSKFEVAESMLELAWGWDQQDHGPAIPSASALYTPSAISCQLAALFNHDMSSDLPKLFVKLAVGVGIRSEQCCCLRHKAACAGALRAIGKSIKHLSVPFSKSATFCAVATRNLCQMLSAAATNLEVELHAVTTGIEELASLPISLEDVAQQEDKRQTKGYRSLVLQNCALDALPTLLSAMRTCATVGRLKLHASCARALRAVCHGNMHDLCRMEPLQSDGNDGSVEVERAAAAASVARVLRVNALCHRLAICDVECYDKAIRELTSELPYCNRKSVQTSAVKLASEACRNRKLVDISARVLMHAFNIESETSDFANGEEKDVMNKDEIDDADDDLASLRRLQCEVEGACLIGSRGSKAVQAAMRAIPALRTKINACENNIGEERTSPSCGASLAKPILEGGHETLPKRPCVVTDSDNGNDYGNQIPTEQLGLLADNSLWNVSGECKDAWLKRFTTALVHQAGSQCLSSCIDAVNSSSKAAEYAAEVAMEHIANKVNDGSSIHTTVSNGVERLLLHAPVEHAEVLLTLIERLRRRRLRALWAKPGGSACSKLICKWTSEAWIRVSSDVVARGALRCGKADLASLWADLHCGEGKLLQEWGASLGDSVHILLHAESQRAHGGDPHRVLALARAVPTDIQAQAQAAARVGMWPEAAAASDVLRQFSSTNADITRLERDRARALRRMGCSLIPDALNHEEQRHAAASLGDWDAAEQEVGKAIEAVALHEELAAGEAVARSKRMILSAIGGHISPPRVKVEGLERLEAIQALEEFDSAVLSNKHGEVALQVRIEIARARGDKGRLAGELRHAAHIERKEAPGRSLAMLREARIANNAEESKSLSAWLDEAKALRLVGQRDSATALLEEAITHHSCSGRRESHEDSGISQQEDIRARCYSVLGKWAGRKREAEEYLNAAEGAAQGARECGRALFHLGAHLEERWRAAESFLREEEAGEAGSVHQRIHEKLQEQMSRSRGGGSGSGISSSNQRMQRVLRAREKELSEDERERKATLFDSADALKRALDSYRRCLRTGCDAYNIRAAYRLLALYLRASEQMPESWMDALESARACGAEALLPEEEGGVPSGKLLPLLSQLASRLSDKKQGNNDGRAVGTVAHSVCVRLAKAFPKQTLPHLYGLKRASALPTISSAADTVWTELKNSKGSEEFCHTATELETLMIGYECLAAEGQNGEITSKQLPIVGRRRTQAALPATPVLTSHSTDPPGVFGFKPVYSVVGGQSKPKLLTCIGTDGLAYLQILKQSPGEDLRQDKVMQQFCGLASDLLKMSGENKTMTMRTYAVAPVSQGCGIVECVEGTRALSDYLAKADVGAHQRLRPQDWKPKECWDHLQRPPQGDKDKAFERIRRNFKPVMRWFFFEHFPDASRWRTAKDTHARSAAVGSMVGFFLGLGDRHASNVLVDTNNGEIVHIDFGIAFDQGRRLPTPERVPFRFTRDVRDGMGPESPQGPFRRTCESAVESLQKHKHALLTVVEVLVHDPLVDWALTPQAAAKRQQQQQKEGEKRQEQQGQSKQERNAEAEKAVLNVRRKLEGHVDGEAMMPEDQVQRLLEQASDVQRLCRMFPGWQPWL